MTGLYPIKFEPIIKERVWGGKRLIEQYNLPERGTARIGEAWEISSVQGDLSIVANGFLEGNNLKEIIEVYLGDIVGDSVYEKFGYEFPLLIKFLDVQENLSIQVHPGNELARERHNAYGKSELWYVIDCSKDAIVYNGFKDDVSKEGMVESLKSGNILETLNVYRPQPGDAFFIPSGQIHSMGGGILVAEIQQTSDITYRIYDWGRGAADGTERELHTDLALDAINFQGGNFGPIEHNIVENRVNKLTETSYFNINILKSDQYIERNFRLTDSFIIYICTDGSYNLTCEKYSVHVKKGDVILIPAIIDTVIIDPEKTVTLLEIYLEINNDK